MIVSERQMVRGISRIIAVTGQEAAEVSLSHMSWSLSWSWSWSWYWSSLFTLLSYLQAREAGQVLSQEVDSLSARLTGSAPSSLDSAQCLAKEVGVLSDVSTLPTMHCSVGVLLLTLCCVCQAVDNTSIPQWQRRDLQSRLRALQRTSNTCVRKLETRQVRHT